MSTERLDENRNIINFQIAKKFETLIILTLSRAQLEGGDFFLGFGSSTVGVFAYKVNEHFFNL